MEGIWVTFAADVTSLVAGVQDVIDSVSSVSASAGSISDLSAAFDDVGVVASETSGMVDELSASLDSVAEATAPVEEVAASLTVLNDDIASVGAATTETADQMDSSLSDVVGAIDNLSSNFADLSANIQEQMASASDSVETMANTASESSGIFGGGMIGMVNKAGMFAMSLQANMQMVEQFGGALLGGNASMEQTDVAFKQLLGSSAAANAELKDLQQFAASTPFEFPELADSTQKLLAFQFPLKETKPLLTSIGDALSGLGENTAAKLDQVVSVFGQMHSSAHLMTGDVMQLTSVGINGFQILADQMHKPVSAIKDMLSKGLIPANDGIEMLRRGMEKTFGGGMQAQSQTFNGLMSTLQDNISSAWRAFTGPLFDAAKQGLTTLGNLVSSKQFQDFATTLGQGVAGAMGTVGIAISRIGPMLEQTFQFVKMLASGWLDFVSGLDTGGIVGAFQGVLAAGKNLASTVGPLIGPMLNNINNLFIQIAGYASGLVAPALSLLGQYIQGMTPYWKNLVLAVSGFTQAAQAIVQIVAPIVLDFVNWVASSGALGFALGFVSQAAGFVATGISTLAGWLQTVANFFNQNALAGQILRDILIGIGAAIAAFQIGAFIASIPALVTGFVTWAVAAGSAAIATIAAMWPILAIGAAIAIVVAIIILAVQHWGAITSWLSGVWSAFSSWFMGALQAVGAFFVGVWQHIVSGLQAAWAMIVNIVKIALLVLLVIIFAPIIAIAALFIWLYQHNTYFKMLVDAIIGFVKAGVAWLMDAWTNIVSWIVAKWQWLNDMNNAIWSAIFGVIRNIVSAIVGFLHGIWTNVINFLSGVWNTISTNVSQMWSTIAGFFSSAWSTYISGPLQGLWSSITGFVSGWAGQAVQWGVNLIQGFINGITSMIGNVGSAVGNIAGKVASFLGFHSPSKEGPGRELDVWAPNMVKEFAQGLDEGVPLIQAAVTHLIQPTSALGAYQGGSNTPSSSLQGNGGGSQQQTVIHNHIYLDGNEIAPHIGEAIVRHVRIATGSKAA